MADVVKSNLGPVTAYADAVKHGYTGTREEFAELLANAGNNLQQADDAKKAAQTAATNAATSEQNANAAKQAAQTAQKNSETAASAANGAKTSAESARDSAQSSATSANTSKEAAAKQVAQNLHACELSCEKSFEIKR